MDSIRGQLLVAAPSLLDPNFWRSVVLIAEHNEEGALGVILNRRADPTVEEAVPGLAELVDGDEHVYVGGPVQPSAVVVLGEFDEPSAAAAIAFDDVGLLGGGEDLSAAADALRRARAFVGHAGWGPGQLEAEIERGDWFSAPAHRDEAFTDDPDHLWSTVLERMGGSFALVARMPPDPALN